MLYLTMMFALIIYLCINYLSQSIFKLELHKSLLQLYHRWLREYIGLHKTSQPTSVEGGSDSFHIYEQNTFWGLKGAAAVFSRTQTTQNDNNEHQRSETDIHDLIRFVEEKSVLNLWFLYSFNAEVLRLNKIFSIKKLIEGRLS
jgi:hypothetical protein